MQDVQGADAETEFRLLETLRWEPQAGFFLLERHVARLVRSARELGFAVDIPRVEAALGHATGRFGAGPQRVRLLVNREGGVAVESAALAAGGRGAWRVGVAAQAVDAEAWQLRHKTTDRGIYERAKAGRPGVDDVVLLNARGEVTESTIANVVVERDGKRVTPPLACGLLPGTFREELLVKGEIAEGVIPVEELRAQKRFWLINSVRGWIEADLVG